MNILFPRWISSRGFLPAFTLFLGMVATAPADQVVLQNGDRYSGKVTSLDSNMVVLTNDIVGTVRLRREQVSSISIGSQPAPVAKPQSAVKAPPVPVVSQSTGPNPQISLQTSVAREITANPQMVDEVRNQVLAGAGPKAVQKYDALTSGVANGTVNVADLRKEAASVAAQLRQLGGSADDENAAIFAEYLAVLDSFVAAADVANSTPKATTASTPSVNGKNSRPQSK